MSSNWKIAWRPAAVVVAALTLSVCGGDASNGTPPGGPSAPVTPTPTPAALAPPAESPLAASCLTVSPGSTSYRCDERGANFQRELEEAISLLKAQKPEVFDGETVLNVGAYVVGIIKNLDTKGVCSTYDGEELVVRGQDDFSEQYDILTATNLIRRYYVGTCSPAVFPLGQAPAPPSPAGCSLAPSREVACGDPPAQFVDDVNGAVEQLLKEKPALFDLGNTAPVRDWPAVKDWPAYYQGILEILARKGYCGRYDGEEIAVKRTNEFSEQYDINYQDKYIRLGPGTYRGACYPAGF